MSKPREVIIEDDVVLIEWDKKLGRIDGKYPTGGEYNNNKVRMGYGARRTVERETLFHELLHKLWDKSGLNKEYSVNTEEYILSSIGGWILLMLQDNPELREYLVGGE